MKSRQWLVIACVLLTVCFKAWAATNLPLGQTATGTIASASQSNSYTFSANANDVVDFTAVTTSGKLSPMLKLYTSGGTLLSSAHPQDPYGDCSGGATLEMNTVQLPASGTYTLLLGDCSSTNTGNYALYAQLTDNPSGATVLPFGQTEAGTIGSAAQSNTYTFTANANDRIDFTLTTSSGTLSPKIRLYNPAGSQLSLAYPQDPYGDCSGGATVEMNTVQIPASGTYTVLVGDCRDTNSGGYEVYAQLTNSPAGPANLPFGQVQSGTITLPAQSNAYTFSAQAKDVLDLTAATISGKLSPKIRLYSPAGGLLTQGFPADPYGDCSGGSILEMNTIQFTSTGTYTILLGDCSDTNSGNYVLYGQLTNNPTAAVSLPFAQVQTGLIGSAAQNNTYTFSANAKDVIDFTAVTTSGKLSPKIRLYAPSGSLVSTAFPEDPYGDCSGGSAVEMNTVSLPASGTYTVLFADCSDTNSGNYALYDQLTDSPSGAAGVLWGQVQSGVIGSAAQSNTFTFSGSAGNSVDFTLTTTQGSLSPKIRLYNPDGTQLALAYPEDPYGDCSGGSAVSLNSITLAESGNYTVLVGDCKDTSTGNYNMSSQCFGTCPLPAPLLTSVSPNSALAGGSGFALTVSGSNFVSGSAVNWNGSARTTTFVSSTQLTAAITQADIATAGSFPVTVLNPTPLAGPSKAIPFAVNNPAPAITSLSPSSATAGSGAFTLTVNGAGFVGSSVVNWNGSARTTTYVSATQLNAAINSADINSPGSVPVTVANPSPGGGLSSGASFTINPIGSSLQISSVSQILAQQAQTITITGSGFGTQAPYSGDSLYIAIFDVTVGNWSAGYAGPCFQGACNDGVGLVVTSWTDTQIVLGGFTGEWGANNWKLNNGDQVRIYVWSAPSGNGPASFTTTVGPSVNNPVPAITSLSPTSATAGGAAFTLTVNGTGFVGGSVVDWNGSARATTYVSATQLTAALSAGDITTASSVSVTAVNPGPGGGPSAAFPFAINAAVISQTITFGSLVSEPLGTAPFTVSGTASSGLPVSFNSLTAAVCTVSGSTVTLVAVGTCTIQATQAGNATYAAASPVNQSFQVTHPTQASQTITFGPLTNESLGTAPFTVSATASSGLPVSFNSLTTTVCSVSGATVTLIGVGTCTIQATQAGNTTYAAASPVNQGFQATPIGIQITSISQVLAQQNQTITITGSGFGTQAPYTGDSSHIVLFDVTVGNWSAGYAGSCFQGACNDEVGLVVTSWTDTQIVLGGFTGAWGVNNWNLNRGDIVRLYIWNANSGNGPATITTTVGPGLHFVPVTPCRLADTRDGQTISGGTSRDFAVPQLGCGIPATALAYSLNVTAVPPGYLGYLTIWPTGQARPNASTLNSWEGIVVANASIVPAGANGAVSVFVSNESNVILDIDGYFDTSDGSDSYSFYPATPCRVADTRNPAGPFGGPSITSTTPRAFQVPLSNCSIPATAAGYSLNFTVVPSGYLGYLSTWPTGQAQPNVSTLNSWTGKVVANAAIVPAGTNESISVYASNPTDVVMDINGFFGAPGSAGALTFYPVTPCRVADTRNPSGTFGGPEMEGPTTRTFPIPASVCNIPTTAAAYSLNMTVVPDGLLSYLTIWPAGSAQPNVSTLNSFDGSVVANAAIVPAGTNGAIDVFVTNPTQVIIDINGYFAP